jgi:hypothetical protein
MTLALCLNCGVTKFGAVCPCPQCKFSTTGDFNLDITFSDHRFSKTTLQAFGAVIASIHRVCDDGQLRFWTFIYTYRQGILTFSGRICRMSGRNVARPLWSEPIHLLLPLSNPRGPSC